MAAALNKDIITAMQRLDYLKSLSKHTAHNFKVRGNMDQTLSIYI